MQQAYVNAFTHLRQFTGAARFSTWLTKIAVNESLARVRRRGRYQAFDDDVENPEAVTHERADDPELRLSLESCAAFWSGRSIPCPTASGSVRAA